MLRHTVPSVAIIVLLAARTFGQELDPSKRERLIVVPTHVAAWNMANTLPQLLAGTEHLSVVAAQGGKVIVIEAAKADIPHITQLIREIDRPQPVITINVVSVMVSSKDQEAVQRIQTGFTEFLTEAMAELEQNEMLRVIDRLQLTTVNEQEALLQVGPKVRRNAGGAVSSNLTFRIIPRATKEGSVLMDLLFDESEPAVDDAKRSVVRRIQTVIEVLPGESVVLAGADEQPDKIGDSVWRLIVSATVKPRAGDKQPK